MNKKDLGFVGIIFFTCIVLLHTVFTLAGFLFASHNFEGVISSTESLQDFYIRLADSSARMNSLEIILWIILPSLLLTISLILINQNRIFKMLLVGFLLSVGIFFLAYGSNQIDSSMRKRVFSEVKDPQKSLDKIRYPGTSSYSYTYRNYYDTVYNTFTYKTDDDRETVVNYYLALGFLPQKGTASEEKLIKKNAFEDKFGHAKTIYLDIVIEGNKTKVTGNYY